MLLAACCSASHRQPPNRAGTVLRSSGLRVHALCDQRTAPCNKICILITTSNDYLCCMSARLPWLYSPAVWRRSWPTQLHSRQSGGGHGNVEDLRVGGALKCMNRVIMKGIDRHNAEHLLPACARHHITADVRPRIKLRVRNVSLGCELVKVILFREALTDVIPKLMPDLRQSSMGSSCVGIPPVVQDAKVGRFAASQGCFRSQTRAGYRGRGHRHLSSHTWESSLSAVGKVYRPPIVGSTAFTDYYWLRRNRIYQS